MAQPTQPLYASPAQTPLGSLHRLAHMLHTPQDMAAARMQASGAAPTGAGAHDEAHVSQVDSSKAERGRWTLFGSPADSFGSHVSASPHMQSSSQQHASWGVGAAEHMVWEHGAPSREKQDPSVGRSESPDASSASVLPMEASTWPQHAAEQDRPDMGATTEEQYHVLGGCGGGSSSTAAALALPRQLEEPQHAAEQAWEPQTAPTKAHNPLFGSCSDVSCSEADEAQEHSCAGTEEQKPVYGITQDNERGPEDLAMLSSWARDAQGDHEDAQVAVCQLRHELQASRIEVS